MEAKSGTINRSISDGRSENGGETTRRKSPLRVEGEWSEHVSSKGLIYYYHCRTEVSQWRKPQEWTLPSMTQEEIKLKLASKGKNGITTNVKRNCSIDLSQDLTTSPKRIKFNDQQVVDEKRNLYNNNFYPKIANIDIKCIKVTPQVCNIAFTNNIKNKNTEANFNNDDMDISPSSSPLSRGSHSDECDKKISHFNFDTIKLTEKSNRNNLNITESTDVFNTSPGFVECSSSAYNKATANRNSQNSYKYQENGNSTILTQYQISLATTLRSILSLLQSRSIENKNEICLSVANISELLTRFEAVLNNGGAVHSYRSHRLQTQLLHNSSYSHYQDPKSAVKLSANINQIKELVKYLQDFIQDNYPHSISSMTPVSPNYSKPVKTQYYMQILHQLVETCLLQLNPQSLTSPSSTSSPGSLKDNNSTISISTSINSHLIDQNTKPDIDSPIKKEKTEPDKLRSVLHDSEMLKFVSSDISNTYRNQLADCYVQEAQVEYYKFVRLHSVLYPELACESKKLKALVRISEINTELFKHKKEDLEKLVHMLELRRLPNHLKCDYLPPPSNS